MKIEYAGHLPQLTLRRLHQPDRNYDRGHQQQQKELPETGHLSLAPDELEEHERSGTHHHQIGDEHFEFRKPGHKGLASEGEFRSLDGGDQKRKEYGER